MSLLLSLALNLAILLAINSFSRGLIFLNRFTDNTYSFFGIAFFLQLESSERIEFSICA